jgi:hypothetical protein
VVCEPKGDPLQVIICNVTTRRPHSDPTTVLNVGDHSFIQHESVIYYARASMIRYTNVELVFRHGRSLEPLKPDVLARVQAGLIASPHTPDDMINFYES